MYRKKPLLSGSVVFRARFAAKAHAFSCGFYWILGQKVGRKACFLDYNAFFFVLMLFTFFRDCQL